MLFPLSSLLADSHAVLQDLIKNSKYICHARVLSVKSQRERYDEKAELVMSRVRLQILENWKGNLESGTEIRSFGGILDGQPYYDLHGQFPHFQKDEEVILFLNDFNRGIFPVGHSLGKKIVKNKTVQETGQSLDVFRSEITNLLR